MQNSRPTFLRKLFSCLGLLLALFLLAGCETVTLTNLTPTALPANPSQIYTITLRVTKNNSGVNLSGNPRIVVDGQIYPMNASNLGDGIYDYDYHLPAGRSDFAYYFLVNYTDDLVGSPTEVRETYTALQHGYAANRYVLSLVTNRGLTGSRVGIVGRGFTPRDAVFFGSVPVRTLFESSNSLSFFVPALPPNQDYPVSIQGVNGSFNVGNFRIDPSNLSVAPASLSLQTGGSQSLTFSVSTPAPAGGLLIDITTDIPTSVIMPEVVIPAGQTSVTVNVQGGQPGKGSLFVGGSGSGQLTVPVTVSAK